MDTVFLRNLTVRGKHGVQDYERKTEQEFIIDIEATCDVSIGARTDTIEDTIDYDRFRTIVLGIVGKNSFYLIEKMADLIASQIMQDERIRALKVTVRKPAVYPDSQPGITIERART